MKSGETAEALTTGTRVYLWLVVAAMVTLVVSVPTIINFVAFYHSPMSHDDAVAVQGDGTFVIKRGLHVDGALSADSLSAGTLSADTVTARSLTIVMPDGQTVDIAALSTAVGMLMDGGDNGN